MQKPRLLVFASGTTEGGGSGFEKLVEASRSSVLYAKIVGVVSNIENGGVRQRAEKLKIPFIYFHKPWTAEKYQQIAQESRADFFPLSGWLKQINGLDLATNFNPKTVFNIHPGPLPKFGGMGFYGRHVHEAVIAAFQRGEIAHTQICMHFVTQEYDRGPIFFRHSMPIFKNDTARTLQERVHGAEHFFQPMITDLVVSGTITWDGISPTSMKVYS